MTDESVNDEKVTEENPAPERSRVGLCAQCRHARRIQSARGSIFYLCRLSATDPNFPKYPRLPVLECSGYEREPAES